MSQELKQETGQQQQEEQSKKRIWQWFGVDVSKDSFTVAFYDGLSDDTSEVLKFDSTPKGVKSFLFWREKHASEIVHSGIVMESTGYYSARLATLMRKLDSSLRVSICNARSVSYYIKSHLQPSHNLTPFLTTKDTKGTKGTKDMKREMTMEISRNTHP